MDIEHVLENGNCHQCGVCVGVCPVDAISIEHHDKKGMFPVFHRSRCTDCDLCAIACPGEAFDWDGLQQDTFDTVTDDYELGHYEGIWSGYTNMPEVRQSGASGGIVSAVLIAMLQKGEIDGAVVVKMDENNPVQPKVYIARTEEEILEAQQSKYLPVPVGEILLEIMKTEGRFAIVGLPCHIHGIRLAQQKMPKLRKRITFLIGLICGFHPSFTSTKFLIRRAGVKNHDEIKEIRYRDDTWPGGFNVIKKDGTNNIIHPVQEFFWAHTVWERERCVTCTDAMAEYADIVCGDEWRDDGVVRDDFKKGWSYVMTRTKRGVDVVNDLMEDGVLQLERTDSNVVRLGMGPTINLKKKIAPAAIRIRKFLGLAAPDYSGYDEKLKLRLKHYLGALLLLVVPKISEMEIVQRIYLKTPTWFFRKYLNQIYKCLVEFERFDELRNTRRDTTDGEPELAVRDNAKILSTYEATRS